MLIKTILLLLIFLTTVASAQQCYFPDGTPSSDVPCNSSAPFSACCSSTGYCLSNGLCFDSGILSRGSCTDSQWKSESCARYWQESNPSGGYALMSCTNTSFTCGFYPDNCAVSSSLFTIENAGPITLRDYQLTSVMRAANVNKAHVASACPSVHSTSGTHNDSGGNKYSAVSMAILGVVLVVVFLAIIGGLVFFLLRERKLRFRIQKQSEKDSHVLLQQPVHSPQQPQPTSAYYGAPTFQPYPQTMPTVGQNDRFISNGRACGEGIQSLQSPARVELDTPVASELDSEHKQ